MAVRFFLTAFSCSLSGVYHNQFVVLEQRMLLRGLISCRRVYDFIVGGISADKRVD
jgi:hypothetical protein